MTASGERCERCGQPLHRHLEVLDGRCQRCLRDEAMVGVETLRDSYDTAKNLHDLTVEELWHHRNTLDGLTKILRGLRVVTDEELVRRFEGDGAYRLGPQTLRVAPVVKRAVRDAPGLFRWLRKIDVPRVFNLSKPLVTGLRSVCEARGLDPGWAERRFMEVSVGDAEVSVVPEGKVKALDALPEETIVLSPTRRRGGAG